MPAFFKNITAQLPDSFIQSNFGLVEYIDGKGQLRPMYEWQKIPSIWRDMERIYTQQPLWLLFFMHERFNNE